MSLSRNIVSLRQSLCVSKWCGTGSLNRAIYSSSAAHALTNENFFAKNERLKRPMSPHLTIYKPQLTSMLSITHRGTGVMLSGLLSSFSIGMLCLPASYPYYIGLAEELHFAAALVFVAKFALSFPLFFHSLNGVRHLAWDTGYGFGLRELYKSGYAVAGVAFVLATVLSLL